MTEAEKSKGRPIQPTVAGPAPDPARIVANLLSDARKRDGKDRKDG